MIIESLILAAAALCAPLILNLTKKFEAKVLAGLDNSQQLTSNPYSRDLVDSLFGILSTIINGLVVKLPDDVKKDGVTPALLTDVASQAATEALASISGDAVSALITKFGLAGEELLKKHLLHMATPMVANAIAINQGVPRVTVKADAASNVLPLPRNTTSDS